MVLLINYEKPFNCYDCPGYDKEHYFCKFNSKIDFDEYPLDPVPPDCPMMNISPKQLHMTQWEQVDDKTPLAYNCSHCATMVHKKTLYCPCCGSFMINGTVRDE